MMQTAQEILKVFEQVAAIPRPSNHEQQISAWLQDWAARRGFSSQTDPAGNLVIRVPATPGHEQAPTLVIQGHLDMVCEKTPDSPHNFLTDPITFVVEGDWLHADRTTLGADNGIAIALAMALVDDPQVVHPALELLFTVEEETGLFGAAKLQKGFINGKILLNLDSEKEGVFTVGCAGGKKTRLQVPLAFEAPPAGQAARIAVGGLKGGHSGVDIDKHRASANKLLSRLLGEIRQQVAFRIAALKGGTAHNAIAREAWATIVFDPSDEPTIAEILRSFQLALEKEFSTAEQAIALTLQPDQAERVLTEADTQRVIDLLQALPHGVLYMSSSVAGFVETSNNLGTIEIQGDRLNILCSQRSNVMPRLNEITRRIEALGHLVGAQITTDGSYPAWQPDMASPLLQRSQEIYQSLFGTPAKVELIHAGLECGLIGEIFGEMDMISLGVTIQDPHSPTERLFIPSLGKVWEFLVALLRAYAQA